MVVLSLFDGMSCGQIALKRIGRKITRYYASEIDQAAITVALANNAEMIAIGDVTKVRYDRELGILYTENGNFYEPEINLIIAGSPCQGFSFAGKQLNFSDPRSALFFEVVRLIEEIKPAFFLLENVRMSKQSENVISKYLGVKPLSINSELVSAQSRYRLYWTNIPNVRRPKNKHILLRDILETEVPEKYTVKGGELAYWNRVGRKRMEKGFVYLDPEKSACLTARMYANWGGNFVTIANIKGASITGRRVDPKSKRRSDHRKDIPVVQRLELRSDDKCNTLTTVQKDNVLFAEGHIRRLTPLECERLQTVPDGYTSCVSDAQAYRMLGNGWTVEVIAHIFSFMPEELPEYQILERVFEEQQDLF